MVRLSLRRGGAVAVAALMLTGIAGTTAPTAAGQAPAQPAVPADVSVLPVSVPRLSAPVRDLPASGGGGSRGPTASRVNPLVGTRAEARAQRPRAAVRDPLIRDNRAGAAVRTPEAGLVFDGGANPAACLGCTPPDPTGDVGPHDYVQIVNSTKVSIFDKTGTLRRPAFDLSALFTSGPCSRYDYGDPQVLYDPMADRWLLSQFTPRGTNSLCFAVSQTPDPLGAYYLYEFPTPDFPDYFKVGAWPTGYYVGTNETTYAAYAFDRTSMLAGKPATGVRVPGETNLLMPADVDGPLAPDAQGGLFYTFKDAAFHQVTEDRIEVLQLTPDFATPANSTLRTVASIPIAPFTYTVCGFFQFFCIPQLGTDQRIDTVSEWPMQRFAYRRFADHEALVGNFTVGGGTADPGASIRWFELDNAGAGWTLGQEGTQDLEDGLNRFMGSIAMDRDGNIALGYSASSGTSYPSVRYATRLAADPLGTLQPERVLRPGGGSQTGSSRWGDYSAMSVDPSDDMTFWYTTEYYAASSARDWSTVIGSFGYLPQTITFPQPPDVRITAGTVSLTATGGGSTSPVVFASTTSGACTTGGADGATVTLVSVGTCTITADQAGDGSYSAAPQVTRSFAIRPPLPPPVPVLAPGAPTFVTATPGDGQVSLAWSPPADPGSAPVTGYTVVATPGSATCSTVAPVTQCTVAGLVNGTAYTFAVTATSSVGTGPAAISAAVTPAAPLPSPGPTASPSPAPVASVAVVSPTEGAPVSSGGLFGVTARTAAVSPGTVAYVTLGGVATAQAAVGVDGIVRFEWLRARVGAYQVRIGGPGSSAVSQRFSLDVRPFGITATGVGPPSTTFTVDTGNWSRGTRILVTRNGRTTATVAVGSPGTAVTVTVPRAAGTYQVKVRSPQGWVYGERAYRIT